MLHQFRRIFMLALLVGALLLVPSTLWGQTYGLKFQGHDVTLDKRTELNLTPDGFMKFQDEFEISFDYKTTPIDLNTNSGFFGYVFRIVSQDNDNIDLLSTPTPSVGLNLVIGRSNTIIPVSYPAEAINNWIKLRIKFSLKDDRLIFYTPDTFYVQEKVGFKERDAYKIIFGANDYNQFKNSDVPCMTIKNIEISEKGKLKYNWLLNEKDGNIAVDVIKGQQAKVINPEWLIVSHQNWILNYEENIPGQLMVVADTEHGFIFMLGEDDLYIYSAQKNTVRSVEYKNRPNFFTKANRAIYNSLDNKIYCYLIDTGSFFTLDLNTFEWNEVGTKITSETIYRHHNSFFNPSDTSIYLFGGYGLHRYKNEIWKIDLTKNTWEELATNDSVFSPRYLAGLGALNDTVYILGGYGSQTGDQLINPHSYFDMFGYSLINESLFKMFDIPRLVDDMVVGNTMWINDKTRDYYALIFSKVTFNGNLQLIRGNLNSSHVNPVGDKIPFKFLDIRSVANLFYLPGQDKLYTCVSYSDDSLTQFGIYSIDNPPNISDPEPLAVENRKNALIIYIPIAILIIAVIVFWIYFRRRKSKDSSKKSASVKDSGSYATAKIKFDGSFLNELPYQLIFFGGFQVISKDQEDITNKFSPLLKELFLLIILYTYKNNKGISSEKISEILWYDKSEKSARNNRAVNIAKLRSLIEEMGPCELSKKTGYWKIHFPEAEIKSDYIDFLHISSSKKNLSKQKVNQLIEITQKGAFLLNVHYDWLDDFKASVSDKIVDTLVEFAKSCHVKSEAEFIVHLADSIFNFDAVNEDAMILKCKAQYCMGKHSQANATYEKFNKEFVSMYNQEYERPFLDILDIKE